jgi:protein kinase C substrate 80K-H
LDDIKDWLVAMGVLAEGPPKQGESKAVTEARNAVNTANNELISKRNQLETDEKDLAKDYGPDEIFRGLKDKCVSKDAGEYTYELCWVDKTTQKSKKGHGNVGMGNFVRIDREMADDEERVDGRSLGSGVRLVLRYEDGQACWNGPRRKTDVWLACSEKEELWRVTESEKCVYKMEVGTPAACEHVAEVKPVGKDEL